MQTKKLRFPGSLDYELGAQLDLPDDNSPLAYALFAHCFTCTKDLKSVYHIGKALTARGVAVLRFDFTGLGESEGDFSDTNFSSNVDDLVWAADYLAEKHQSPKILIGHSLGGAAVIQAAGRIPSCRAVATIAAPADPGHASWLLEQGAKQAGEGGGVDVELGGRRFRLKQQFFDDLEQNNMKRAINKLDRALLIFHAPGDLVVGIDHAARIFMTAKHPKSFISLDQADHLLTDEADSRYVGAMVATWASKYV